MKQMDHPALSAARVWSVSITMCASRKDAYSRGGFLADGRAAMLKVGGKWHLSSLSCHVRTALVCKYFMLNCGYCSEEKERTFPRPKHPHTTLVFPFPYQPASHLCYVGLAYSSSLGWANPPPTASCCDRGPQCCAFFPHPSPPAECGRTLGKPHRNLSPLCSESRLNFGKGRGQREEGRTNPLSPCDVHTFSAHLLIVSSLTSLLSLFPNNSNKCQIQSHLMKCTPIK